MKNMKKTLALLLALAMCVSMLGTTALAAPRYEEEVVAETPMGEEVREGSQKSAAPAAAAPAELEKGEPAEPEETPAAELMEAETVSGTMTGAALLGKAVGGVITLDGDVTLTSTMTVNKDITLELNGHTLSTQDVSGSEQSMYVTGNTVLSVSKNVTATVKGGTVKAGTVTNSNRGSNPAITVSNGGSLKVESAAVLGADAVRNEQNTWASGKVGGGVAISASTTSTVEVVSSTIQGGNGIGYGSEYLDGKNQAEGGKAIAMGAGTLTITDSTVTGGSSNNYNAEDAISTSATTTITNSTVTGGTAGREIPGYGIGGDAISVSMNGADITVKNSTIAVGAPGHSWAGICLVLPNSLNSGKNVDISLQNGTKLVAAQEGDPVVSYCAGINAPDIQMTVSGTVTVSKGKLANKYNKPQEISFAAQDADTKIVTEDGATIPEEGTTGAIKLVPPEGAEVVKGEDGNITFAEKEPVATVGEQTYFTLQAAIDAAENGQTVTILKAGGYAPITVPAGVTVQAAEGVAVTFKGSFEGSVKVGANVIFKNLTFEGANPLNSSVGDNLTVKNCTFEGDSSDTGTAMYIHTPNITVENCTFKNYRRGYYTCGDNHAIGKIVFTGNTFENVKIPFDGYWGKKATDSTQVDITGNTFKNDGKPVYVCLWDYTQYLNSNQADRQGSALANVTVKNNEGDYQLQLIHTDWRWATPEVTTDDTNANVVYCSYVEVENADNVTALKAQWAGEGELPDFMDHTTAVKKNGKLCFYEIPAGQYNVTVTYTNGASVTQALEVVPQTVEDNTQKLTLPSETPKVAQVGETKYDSLHDAITAAKTGENKIVTMLADQTVDTWNQIWNVNGVTIEGGDHTLTVKKIESGVNGNYLLYDATGLKVHDLKVVLPNGGNGFDVSNSELSNVSITGAKWGVAAGSNVTITGCTFKDNTYAIYTNDRGEGENLKVTNNTFTGGRAIILRNDEEFTGNTVTAGAYTGTMVTVNSADATVTNNKLEGNGALKLYKDTKIEGNAILCKVETNSGVTADLSGNYWGEDEPTGLPEGITVLSRYTQWDDESKTASVPVVGSGAVAEVDGKYYASLQAAITAATEGQTVKLLKDAKLTGQTNLVGINLDLGGKTISYASEDVVLGLVAWGTVTIKNGTINVPNYGIYVVSGHTTAENLTVVAQAEKSTGIYVNGDATFTLDKDSSVSAGWYGIVAYGTTKDNVVKDPTLKIYGKVTADDGYAITGNGNRKTAPGSLINIYDGAEVKSDRYIAIYHPQAGKLNILGGLVEGDAAGIAIKSGTLNVKSGATVSCVGEYKAPTEPNGNGAEASGAAIQIEANSGYAGDIEVNVEDGATVKSTNGNAIYQYYGWKNNETVDQAKLKLTKITITGGAIIGGSGVKAVDVYDAKNADGKIAISGGTFSTDVSDYCVEGYQATRNTDGTYGVAQITGGNTSGSGTTGGNENLDEPDVPLTDKPFLFTDVAESDWFYDAVKYAFNNDLMLGTTDTTFEPGMTASRGMIVTMLHRLEKEPTAAAKADFPDVEDGAWYTEAVHWGNEAGVVTGYSDGRYAPDDMITREQLVVILYRYAKLKGCDMSARADLSKYTDVDQVSGYAADAMAWAVEIGLVKGTSDTTLSPAGDATRGQIATIMTRLCEDVLPKEA